MGIAAVETGLATVIAQPEFFHSRRTLANPELALRRAAREDNVRKFLDFLSQGRVCGLAHTRCAVGLATCYSNEDILLRPIALAVDLPQLVKIDLKLRSPVRERDSIISYRWICPLTKTDQIVTSAIKAIAICMKLKAR
jgi:hypothetical protein